MIAEPQTTAELQMILEKLTKLEKVATLLRKNEKMYSEWMSISDGAKYADVSVNTFRKFRLMGLKVSQIDGVKKVSRKEIDRFLEENSY